MDKKKPVIVYETENVMDVVTVMKLQVAGDMQQWEENLLNIEAPSKEDYESIAEYDEDLKGLMIELVDTIKTLKEKEFTNILNSYNGFLSEKLEAESYTKKGISEAIELVKDTEVNVKFLTIETGVLVVIFTLVFAPAIPIVLVFNASRIGFNLLAKKVFKHRIERNELIEETMREIQLPFFDFTMDLREDYHKSNKELAELRKRAENGENVIEELLEIVKPERLGLTRPTEKQLEEFDFIEKLMYEKKKD